MHSSNVRIYNELLDAHMNYYNNLHNTINSERGINLAEYNKQQNKLVEKIEEIMKHFVFFGSSAANVVKINIMAQADAAKACKGYFDLEEDKEAVEQPESYINHAKEEIGATATVDKTEGYPAPVMLKQMTKATLLHRYKQIYAKYKESFPVCQKQSAVEAMQRSLEAEIKVVTDHAISSGLSEEIVKAVQKEAKELFWNNMA